MKNLGILLVALGATLLQGCFGDNNQTILQWMPDMADAPTVKPQESFIDPPDGSVHMRAGIYPETVEEAEEQLNMPPQIAQSASAAPGKKLFETFCMICHGPHAKGSSTLPDDFPGRPDLTADSYKNKKDGFFFYRITFGSVIMPPYGYSISPGERWQIVKYLRTLQNAH